MPSAGNQVVVIRRLDVPALCLPVGGVAGSLGLEPMVDSMTYYDLVGAAPGASPQQVRAAVLDARRVWSNRRSRHPSEEVRLEAAVRLRQLTEAEGVLLDPVRRAQYDASLAPARPPASRPARRPAPEGARQPAPAPPGQPAPASPPPQDPLSSRARLILGWLREGSTGRQDILKAFATRSGAAHVSRALAREVDSALDELLRSGAITARRAIRPEGTEDQLISAAPGAAALLEDSIGLPEYTAFAGTLPSTAASSPQEVLEGLVQIASVEGPLTARRLFRAYVLASGGQKVGKLIRRDLEQGLSLGETQRVLATDRPLGETDVADWTVRLPVQPAFELRRRGPREFQDIPPGELAAHLAATAKACPNADFDHIARECLRALDTKRLTEGIQARLRSVAVLARPA